MGRGADRPSARRRSGVRAGSWLAMAALLLVIRAPARGQDPDTARVDTIPEVPDSLRPPPLPPEFPDVMPTGWAFGIVELTRDELLRYRGVTLLDLVERLPGIIAVRGGAFGRPSALGMQGSGGGRVRVFIDGVELDPIARPTHDLARVGLIDLETLRVERGFDGIRIDARSFRLPDARPYSEVEVATGNYDIRVLRAMLSRPIGARNVFTGAFDLGSTNGIGVEESFQMTSGRAAWSYLLTPDVGLAAEFRQGGMERAGDTDSLDATRRDLVLRARAAPLPGLVVDAVAGQSSWLPGGAGQGGAGVLPPAGDTVRVESSVRRTHGLLRAGFRTGPTAVEAALRIRGGTDAGVPVPGSELELRGSLAPLPFLALAGRLSGSSLGGSRASFAEATARVGPLSGLSLFASGSVGTRWIALSRDSVLERADTLVVDADTSVTEWMEVRRVFDARAVDVGGVRAGAEWGAAGASVGAAILRADPTLAAPLGFAFDRGLPPVGAGAAEGYELFAVLPVPRTERALRLEGWYQSWSSVGSRPYLPGRIARAALEFHDVFIEGQFEPTARVEVVHRGESIVPGADRKGFDALTDPYTLINFFLQLRILDVRAFLFWENVGNDREALDLPAGLNPGQRLIYGARWYFRN